MFDFQFFPLISSYFVTIPIQKNNFSSKFADLFHESTRANFAIPSSQDIESIEATIKETNQTNEQLYLHLVQILLQTIDPHKL